ncbi:MAG: hypothetical protein J7647_03635 [Cyanobacteria bacterium SBLK]|nr:hypothetical protein [Cyanobacteria bacterium SBLK]
MSYSNFTNLNIVQQEFNLILEEDRNLFADITEILPSDYLRQTLAEYLPLATAINTEKARSEFLLAPILAEVRRQANYKISLFSGTEFEVDRERGLSGYCDYLICCSKEQYFIRAPVVTIVEAKNENIKGGLGQCVAEMVAAQIFNQQQQLSIPKIYGAVSTGTTWKFLLLDKQTVFIDAIEYYINQIAVILGILLQPIRDADVRCVNAM